MEIRVLGAIEVWHVGERLPAGTPQQRCVLAMLALAGDRGQSVERLVEVLWPDDQPDGARGLVHGYISRLRKALRPAGVGIVRRSPGYAIDVEPSTIDLHLFRDLVLDARAETEPGVSARRLCEALALWRGEPLSGLPLSSVLDRVRAGLEIERVAVIEEWAELELRLGRHRELVGELATRSAEYPYQEKLVGLLLLALHRCGRQAEALRRYEQCRRLLADTLGVDPSAELRGLYERILRADPALSWPAEPAPTAPVEAARAPNSLPFAVPDFVGREDELARLLTAGARVISIDGMAGVGKTALAVHAAHALSSQYPDAQLFVDLHGFTPGREPVSADAALGVLLRSVGLAPGDIPTDHDERVATWRTEMAGRRAVVVLDNALDAAHVRPLVPGAPGCVVIVTSRRRLITLDGAVPLTVDVLRAEQAAELFCQVAGIAGRRHDEVAELLALCGHLPLALRVAGARLRHRPQWTVADLVERLRAERLRLTGLAVHDRDVAAAFTVSYDYLDAGQQRMFRRLGLHPGPDIDAHAAAAISAEPRADELLEDLLDHHLLEQRTRDRFRFHDLIRDHAQRLAAPAEDQVAAAERLLDYFAVVTDRAADALQPGRRRIPPNPRHWPVSTPEVSDHASALAWYAAEHPNLVAATACAARAGLDRHVRDLPRNFGHYLVISHHIDDLVAIAEPAAEAARRLGEPAAESISLSHLALTYYMAGRYRLGLRHADGHLVLARELGDLAGEVYALGVSALLHQRLGEYTEAVERTTAAIALCERTGERRMAAICLANLGRVALLRRDPHRALPLLEEALARTRAIGERSEEASVLSALGATTSLRGDHGNALRLLHEGVELAREVGNTDYTVRGTIKLAEGHRRAGHTEQARAVVSGLVPELPANADHLTTALNVLGHTHLDARDPAAALAAFTHAHTLATRLEYRIEQANALAGLAAAHTALGDHNAAAAHGAEADTHFLAMEVKIR
ncbi:BTAD domain-containing putative transcriptional regulator [Actinokineospora sp. NBRC 105648]|uniref:AfsR/SARP family transcriptional regulator n=1 Tax=Actinokineospora sp. NBRC 105648 TaxID=3032206 RepID=UPI0024A03013|nr:BTAD domain-containing putative transcriptional regulator [Actinokineospora sp. NBRC 105648]GLZ39576.1 SARP family transcriptional regulator [Actinokineospora sp. NBRC 105648]